MSSGLEKLVEDIIRESKTKAEELKKQALAQVQETLAKERADALREADLIIRSAKSEADAERNRRISQAKQQARLLYLAEKNKVVRDVLKDLRSGLVQFARDDSAYGPFLLKSIAQGLVAVSSETVKIALSERDAKKFKSSKMLEEALAAAQTPRKAVLSDKPIAGTGGAIVTSEDGKIRADCTLEARLQLMEPQLLAEISRILFAS